MAWGRVIGLGGVAALGLVIAGPVAPVPVARAASCAVWAVSMEDDTTSKNLTASACSSSADDTTAVGFQCTDRPQLRYYPGDDAPDHLTKGMRVSMTFAVDPDSVVETMRYDEASGAFYAKIGNADPVFALLQTGGPLVVSSDLLGSHTFRLLGSTAALTTIMARCGRPLPNPPMPAPTPPPTLPPKSLPGRDGQRPPRSFPMIELPFWGL